MVCYNKQIQIYFLWYFFSVNFQNQGQVKGQDGENNDPVTDDFALLDRN